MVDKIERPERISAYRIEASKQANDEENARDEQQSQEFFTPQQENEWQKFHGNQFSLHTQVVPRSRIAAVRFKSTMLRQGVPTLLARIDWKNGQETEVALLRLQHVEDYLKLRSYQPMQAVPDVFWSAGEEVEIAVPQATGGSGSFSLKRITTQETPKAKPIHVWRQRLLVIILLSLIILLLILQIFG